MGETFYLSTDAYSAVLAVEEAVMDNAQAYGCEIADEYTLTTPSGVCFMKTYEKRSELVTDWLTLTLISDNFGGSTKVHITVTGGRGRALGLKAQDNLVKLARKALEPYIQ